MANAEILNHIDVRCNLFCLNSIHNIELGDLRRISSPGLESFLKINRMDIAINNILNEEKNIFGGMGWGFYYLKQRGIHI